MASGNTEIQTYFGRCRCCLNYGYLKNMWQEHEWQGAKEIYVEMLLRCFALSWEQSDESMEHDQICENCIMRLRDADQFKKTILESQDQLLNQVDEDSELPVKIEHSGLSMKTDSDDDGTPTTPMYIDDPDDPDYVDQDDSNDIEYENVEYLEQEDNGEGGTSQQMPKTGRRTKQPSLTLPERKWPRKLPKAERYKTYKQYTQEDLRKCIEAVRNEDMTAQEASERFNIPKKTILGKVKIDPKDVRAHPTEMTIPQTRTKNINKKYTKTSLLQTKSDSSTVLMKNLHNLELILKHSNSTIIKNSSRNYGCNFCDHVFEKPDELKIHSLNHGDMSEKAISTKSLTHLIVKVDITDLKCKICKEKTKFDNLESFLDHLQIDHEKIVHKDINHHIIPFKFDNKKLNCAICNKEYKHFKLLSEHMSDHYTNYQCNYCKKFFINRHSMQLHSYRHQKGVYQCSKCPKIFDSKPKRTEHERITHIQRNKKRKCRYCDQKFSSKETVENHETKIHGVTQIIYQCEACDKLYQSQRSLLLHKRRFHLLSRTFQCDFCPKSFFSKGELKWHLVVHTKTKEFDCEWCDSSFGTKPALNQHMRAHLGDRRYKCGICKFGFVHVVTWRRHMWSQHDDQKGNTTENKKKSRQKPTKFHTDKLKTKVIKKVKMKKFKTEELNTKDGVKEKDDLKELLMSIKTENCNVIDVPVHAEQVRTKYKALINAKFKKENTDAEKSDVNEMNKHKDNIKNILECSNATMIKGYWGNGYSCCFCDVQKEIPSELKRHNLETHINADDAIKVKYVSDLVIRLDITDLKCKLCETNMDNLEIFTEHLVKIHDKFFHKDIKNYVIPFKFETDSLQCIKCSKQFKYFKLLSEHMSEHYRNYECSVCQRSFINKQSMQTHSYRHKNGIFKCSHCPKVFDTKPKRSVHERVTHTLANKTRKCNFCDEKFSTKDLVQNHEAKIHGAKIPVFNCQACSKSYNSQSSLMTHRKRFHLMLRPHKCSYCDMAFFSRIESRSHTVTHTKSREFKCEMCNKCFGTRCSLNQHVRGHLNDRRFKCDSCDRAFVHRTAFKVHMRSKHGKIV